MLLIRKSLVHFLSFITKAGTVVGFSVFWVLTGGSHSSRTALERFCMIFIGENILYLTFTAWLQRLSSSTVWNKPGQCCAAAVNQLTARRAQVRIHKSANEMPPLQQVGLCNALKLQTCSGTWSVMLWVCMAKTRVNRGVIVNNLLCRSKKSAGKLHRAEQ